MPEVNGHNGKVLYQGEEIDLQEQLRRPTVQEYVANAALPRNRVAAIDALEALVSYNGDIVLAAQHLNTSPQMVLASVVGDQQGHDLLARFLRAYTMTKTFGLVNLLQGALADYIADGALEAKDVAKTLVGLIQGMSSLTDTAQAPQADPFVLLMKVLPPDEREALAALMPGAAKAAGLRPPSQDNAA